MMFDRGEAHAALKKIAIQIATDLDLIDGFALWIREEEATNQSRTGAQDYSGEP